MLKKTNQAWIWIALCRKTRKAGCSRRGRSKRTDLPLLVGGYSTRKLVQVTVVPIFLAAYQAVIPADQHKASGKETGETAHVERWNTTLRQRLARFVRKTLSFSRINFLHTIPLFKIVSFSRLRRMNTKNVSGRQIDIGGEIIRSHQATSFIKRAKCERGVGPLSTSGPQNNDKE